ncbi:MAG: 4-chlorobenzoate--CoA ligase [Planctomycetes bacterium]|nr:4-chlorobenzoate--CoA ligase [Planctomycetota bacterium]
MTISEAELPVARAVSAHAEAPRCNVSDFIFEQAKQRPDQAAVIEHASGRRVTYAELAKRIENITFGLTQLGICNGARTVFAIKPGIEFVETVFALFRAGAVPVVVDPGMGVDNMLKCIEEAQPTALVGIPMAHLLSKLKSHAFRSVKQRVTVGRRWLWGGASLDELRNRNATGTQAAPTTAETTAAILFTSGATGVPKGVVFRHGVFVGQTEMIRDAYGIQPGEVDVPCFALFALFSVAMGVTIVLPDIDFSNPGKASPARVVDAINAHHATMSFGSPAVWKRVGPYLEQTGVTLPTIKRILIAGAPVPYTTLAMFKGKLAPDGDLHTPYGATESLPFSTISASEILGETRHDTASGAGTCVGKPLPGVNAKVIRFLDGPIASLDDAEELPAGEVGEIIVNSPVTTQEYFNRPENNRLAKIGSAGFQPASDVDVPSTAGSDGRRPTPIAGGTPALRLWHRMGDAGYFDARGRLWFCGRVNHRVETANGTLWPIQVEAIFNNHDAVSRCALVGLGDRPKQVPCIVIELHEGHIPEKDLRERIRGELQRMADAHELTRGIRFFLFHEGLPVDVRHNAKINREALKHWADTQLPEVTQ